MSPAFTSAYTGGGTSLSSSLASLSQKLSIGRTEQARNLREEHLRVLKGNAIGAAATPDVELVVILQEEEHKGGQERVRLFHGHQCVLQKSPLLRRLFLGTDHRFQEKVRVVLADYAAEAVQAMIMFLYTGRAKLTQGSRACKDFRSLVGALLINPNVRKDVIVPKRSKKTEEKKKLAKLPSKKTKIATHSSCPDKSSKKKTLLSPSRKNAIKSKKAAVSTLIKAGKKRKEEKPEDDFASSGGNSDGAATVSSTEDSIATTMSRSVESPTVQEPIAMEGNRSSTIEENKNPSKDENKPRDQISEAKEDPPSKAHKKVGISDLAAHSVKDVIAPETENSSEMRDTSPSRSPRLDVEAGPSMVTLTVDAAILLKEEEVVSPVRSDLDKGAAASSSSDEEPLRPPDKKKRRLLSDDSDKSGGVETYLGDPDADQNPPAEKKVKSDAVFAVPKPVVSEDGNNNRKQRRIKQEPKIKNPFLSNDVLGKKRRRKARKGGGLEVKFVDDGNEAIVDIADIWTEHAAKSACGVILSRISVDANMIPKVKDEKDDDDPAPGCPLESVELSARCAGGAAKAVAVPVVTKLRMFRKKPKEDEEALFKVPRVPDEVASGSDDEAFKAGGRKKGVVVRAAEEGEKRSSSGNDTE